MKKVSKFLGTITMLSLCMCMFTSSKIYAVSDYTPLIENYNYVTCSQPLFSKDGPSDISNAIDNNVNAIINFACFSYTSHSATSKNLNQVQQMIMNTGCHYLATNKKALIPQIFDELLSLIFYNLVDFSITNSKNRECKHRQKQCIGEGNETISTVKWIPENPNYIPSWLAYLNSLANTINSNGHIIYSLGSTAYSKIKNLL